MGSLAKPLMLWIVGFASLTLAQDITGTWQGTRLTDRELRTVIRIFKVNEGDLRAVMYSIDEGGQGGAATITLQNSTIRMSIPGLPATYQGKLDSDGSTIAGIWTQAGRSLPLNLKRVTGDAAWLIPEPLAGLKPMAADAHLVFEVATIKPSKPGSPPGGLALRGGRHFVTAGISLSALIAFAFAIHVSQIAGGPAWLDSEGYDILAEPEAEGHPTREQAEIMIQRLLADRFKLAFHRDKKELSAYVILVGKNGPKLTSSSDQHGGPSFGTTGPGMSASRNVNMSDFADFLQFRVLDRPVVDQTGLLGRFDFELKWTPDERQFGGRGTGARQVDSETPPDLFVAIQEQLGLQLKLVKAPVNVLVIDHVERPSSN